VWIISVVFIVFNWFKLISVRTSFIFMFGIVSCLVSQWHRPFFVFGTRVTSRRCCGGGSRGFVIGGFFAFTTGPPEGAYFVSWFMQFPSPLTALSFIEF
jgi:hypothetical protein